MAPVRPRRGGRTALRGKARRTLAPLALLGVLALSAGSAQAAGPPQITAAWATNVAATSAALHLQASPEGLPTTARFEYLTEAAYEANLAQGKEGFFGATRSPLSGGVALGSGSGPAEALRQLTSLGLATAYRYRAVVINSAAPGGVIGPEHVFTTQPGATTFFLADNRGWEMVSPVDKNGGAIQGFGENFGGGVLQAAAQGGQVTYSSASSFGTGAQGAPAAAQYLAGRETSAWSSLNISPPQRSGAEPAPSGGVPHRLFSGDLSSALVFSGGDCLSPGVGCANPSPPPPGSGAPAGYQDYYLKDSAGGGYQALITNADAPALTIPAEAFEVGLAGATEDLSQVVLSTCAKLTAQATEVPAGEGCEGARANLYRWSGGALEPINILPGGAQSTPGAKLAAQSGAISADGNRAYFTEAEDGFLYLREGAQTKPVTELGAFQSASSDGSIAYFTKAAHLYRYQATTGVSTDLTPGGEVQGVLGGSADGAYLYYETASGLLLWHEGTTTPVAGEADAINWPPATGTARVGPDGTRLLFSSSAALSGFDNTDSAGGKADAELFLYDAAAKALSCVSCNPTGERPLGPASVPGAISNGQGEAATRIYKPRVLSAGGNRAFFDSSDDLALQDTNNRQDVYQWEAPGSGSCARGTAVNGGCVSLISSGRDGEASSFIDASADGEDAFFLTAASLVPADPGSVDLYDARAGGGFPLAPAPIPCDADSCQPLPSEPEDPTPGTLVVGEGNPPLRFTKGPEKSRSKKHKGHKGHKGHSKHKGAKK
jgi:hypothetical protein